MISAATLAKINAEAARQDEKWGEQNFDPEVWLSVLVEEVGELAQAMLAHRFRGAHDGLHDSHNSGLEAEAVQIAAVAGQFIEYLYRRGYLF